LILVVDDEEYIRTLARKHWSLKVMP